MKLNMDGVEAWKAGELLPVGWHDCEIMEIEEATASTGTSQIKVKVEAYAGEAKGGSITDFIAVTEGSMGRVLQFLEAADYSVPSGDFDFQPGRVLGKRVRVLVVDEDYKGEMKRRVKGYTQARAQSDVPADTSGLSAGQRAADESIPF